MRMDQKIIVTNRMLGCFSVFTLWISIRDASIIALEELYLMLSSFSAPPKSSTNQVNAAPRETCQCCCKQSLVIIIYAVQGLMQ